MTDIEVSELLIEADTQLEQMCRLKFNAPAAHRRLTGIVCTIGRASRNLEKILKMLAVGMNIVRLNFSHDSHEFHSETVELVRQATEIQSQALGYQLHVALALDTKGPEIRTGLLESSIVSEIELKKGDNIRLSVNKDLMDKGTRECVFVDYANIINVLQPGDKLYLNDGAIALVVKEVAVDCVICQIETGGPLGSRKSVKLPGIEVDLPPVSEKDVFDLKFGVELGVDFVFASSVRSSSAIHQIRNVLGEKGKHIKIVAKIESMQGLGQLDEIVNAADGILFDRGDINVEVTPEKVILIQKAVIARCNRVGKPVVCATQVLESMRVKETPRLTDVSDLINAILDGADCVMLSSESAIGMHPVQAVTTMSTIAREAEAALWYRSLFEDLISRHPAQLDAAHSVAISAVEAAKKSLAVVIVVLTTSGRSAYLISKYRPRCPILALTRCPRSARQSHLYRGLIPLLYAEKPNTDWHKDVDNRLHYALVCGKKMGIIRMGDPVIVVSPWQEGTGFTNNMRIVYAFFENESLNCMLKNDQEMSKKITK